MPEVNPILLDAFERWDDHLLNFYVHETIGTSVVNLRGMTQSAVHFDDCQDKDAP